jgi:hypothetical protein
VRALAIAVVLVMSLGVAARAQNRAPLPPEIQKLYDDKPVIELVTMGVGSLIWERHGHIALCVEYENPRDNVCYNYGIGDFHHPVAMGWGFFRGEHSFWVGKMNPREMLDIYRYADRSIWVQPLPLTQDQKQKVLQKLEYDVLEDHKYYAYDHFDDNCTTRIRDVIDNATDHALSSMPDETDGRTFRDLAREGFFGIENSRMALLITDLAMGRSTDRVPTYWERMFLPQYLREAVQKKWGIAPITIYERQGAPPQTDGPSGRVILALVILFWTSLAWIPRLVGKFQRTGAVLAMAPYVLVGAILLLLAIVSPLPYVRWNETVLVWVPFDIIAPFLSEARGRLYARGRLVMLGLVLLLHLVGLLKQPLIAPMLWPLIPLLVIAFSPSKIDLKSLRKPT